ncbi:hypothetical protein HHK36_026665 [Tetracentron sinense]|uniref:DUF7804 domain-containing protein n=1 Tax=Tetracentron sinense TaxID=13715 RepID=A0A834YGE6_TETSI|nr:hypothetical protein HHK36_026665 [Tetracentron sinense]
MESLGLCLGSGGGNALFSYRNADEQQRHLGRTQSFLQEVKTKSRQQHQYTARACLVVNQDNGSRAANMTSCHPINLDPIFFKEETCSNRRETNINAWKKVVNKEVISSEKLDDWIRDSVVEIVRNIEEAPFLVHIYSKDRSESSATTTTRLEREKAGAESWPLIGKRWTEGKSTPDGIILVEELKDEENRVGADQDKCNCNNNSHQLHSTKAWGILIQGKGVACSACYILKTCRVHSSLGFCTHFCLVKAKCFGDTTELQLKKSWLQEH